MLSSTHLKLIFLVSIGVIKHHDEKQLGEKNLFQLIVQHEGKSGQGLEAETKAKVMKKQCYWLVSCGLGRPGPPINGGTTHSMLSPPHHIINQENTLQICYRPDGSIFSSHEILCY